MHRNHYLSTNAHRRIPAILLTAVAVMAVLLAAAPANAHTEAIAGRRDPLVFLGNHTLPPMIYRKDGRAAGIVVDLAEALAARMGQPVQLLYMNWTQAQQMVREGRADALLQINSSPEREAVFDFSDPLLESEFSIFVPSARKNIYDLSSLDGLRVGVEEKGLPTQVLGRRPRIDVVVVPDIVSGFRHLAAGTVDAVVVDRWVGEFVLAENGIEGIRAAGEPIERSRSAIAVRKGEAELLAAINRALAAIRSDGTYTKILAKWRPQEVVYQTRRQIVHQKMLMGGVLVTFCVSVVWALFLLREIKKRRRVIEELEGALSEIKTLSGLLPICSICKKVRDSQGYWKEIESYIAMHTDADFSHSICEGCVEKHYPELAHDED